MKKRIKISRSNFPNKSMLYWFSYFKNILEQKYEVEINSENPDLVIYSNVYMSESEIDTVTGNLGRSVDSYNDNVKKIFCSGEIVSDYSNILFRGENYFAIGPQPVIHDRYLRMQLHNTTSAWGLYDESKIFDNPYNWLTDTNKNVEEILSLKKYFCGVVQNSKIDIRIKLFNLLSNYKFVRASGGWITNVSPEEATINGITDGIGYKSKIDFLKNCKFSLQVQSSNLSCFTHEKMIHAFAANTIPIFYGNNEILEDGFNPNSFINCHQYSSLEEVVEKVIEIDKDDELFKKILREPYFVNNKLPEYFQPEYLLNFFDKIINL
jgi:hypothetical protein